MSISTRPPNGSAFITEKPQFSLLKTTYQRHFDIMSRKEVYDFDNNRLTLPINGDLEIVDKLWISNINNIKNIAVFLVNCDCGSGITSNYICDCDMSSININDQENHSYQGAIWLIYKMNNIALQTYNALHGEGKYLNLLPCLVHAFVPQRYNATKILFVIDKYDEHVNNNLTVKYMISNDIDEKRRFFQAYHEWMIRKYISFEYDLNIGENVIDVEFLNNCIFYVMVNIEKTSDPISEIEIEYKTYGLSREDKIVKRNILSTHVDEEFCYVKLDNYDTFILDAYMNTQQLTHQPMGIFEMREGSKFKIHSKHKTKISITYCVMDVVRCCWWNAELYYNKRI